MHKTFGQLIADYAARKATETAIRYSDDHVTWAELDERSTARALQLRNAGVKPDDLVAIAMANGIAHHEMALAAWKAGATPCILPSKLPANELAQILEVARPSVVIRMGEPLSPVTQIDPSIPAPQAAEEPLGDLAPRYFKAVASGGSTGRPKLIVDHNEGRMTPGLEGLIELLDIPREGVLINPGPLYHNAPFLFSSLALLCGSQVVGLNRFDPEETLRLIERHNGQFLCLVPTMMQRIIALPPEVRARYDLSSLKVVWHMAAACPPWLKRAWIDWLGPDVLKELYAGTEGPATVITGREWLEKPGSVGKVAPDTLKILDADGDDCGPGEVGEIYFPAIAADRFHYVGATLSRTPEGRFSLGDLGHVDKDGYLFLADRRTDLILRGGANIYPAEVEGALDEHPDVVASVVVGIPAGDIGQRVHAIVEVRHGSDLELADLDRFVRAQLSGYKCPESYEISAGPLKDEAGKVRRGALKAEREAWLAEGRAFQTRPDRA
jgi:bile acid-coenzyme A ligase